jgi:DNA helicase IV
MEYRMLRRRSSTLSFTIVGDVNQKASPAGVAKWEELSELLGEVAVKYLTVNYRNSQEIAEYAYQEAVKRHLEVPLTKSPRDVVGSVEVVKSKSAQETVKLAIQYANELAHLGRTAVITQAPEQIPNSTHYDTMTAVESKGLEYDSVIIVNPEEIGSAINGNSNLYVSITRATSKLVVIEE